MPQIEDVKIETAQLPLVNPEALDEVIRAVCPNFTGLSVDAAGVRLHFFHAAEPEERNLAKQIALKHDPTVLSKRQEREKARAIAKLALYQESMKRPDDSLAQALAKYLELEA